MNIVFIHGNFPGQFKHLIANLERVENIKTYFITERDIVRTGKTEITKLEIHRDASENTHHYLRTTEECILRGQGVIRKLMEMEGKGIAIDVVICHGGMGYGLFVKDYRPVSIVISYNEWYFTEFNSNGLFADYSFDDKLITRTRNFTTLSEIESCDLAICPSEWQKKQFPSEYWGKLKVIYDGIDHRFFCEGKSEDENITISNRDTGEDFMMEKDEIVVSYATRGMEPLRCFGEFMSAIPHLTKRIENIKIIIAGADRVAYSYQAPNKSGSWKEYELDKMDEKTKKQVIFTGLLNWEDYRKLLRRSNLHCYFSRPYVLSWSFIESAACGANIATNEMEAMKEVVVEDSVHWVNIEDPIKLAESMEISLKKSKKAKLKQNFTVEDYLLEWQETINKIILSKK